MICAVVADADPRRLPAALTRAQRLGADAVELRLDALADPAALDLEPLLASRPLPVIATCRPHREGGAFVGTEAVRRRILTTAAGAGADWVDLELGCQDWVPPGGPTRRIVSHHDFERTPDDLEAIADRIAATGADLVKLAVRVADHRDTARLLRLPTRLGVPCCALGMGPAGRLSRIAYRKFGGALTYAPLDPGHATAPGQLPLAELIDVYAPARVGPRTRLFGLLGAPLGHSASPLLHNAGFRAHGVDALYLPFESRDATAFRAAWQASPTWTLEGLSVTMPHKTAVLPWLASIEPRGATAVNTIVARGDALRGYDTDGPGALAALREAGPLPADALLLGTGGAARSVGAALVAAGVRLTVSGRRDDAAAALAAQLGAAPRPWHARDTATTALLVNATPLGMAHLAGSPMPAASLGRFGVVMDLVYRPRQTALLRDATRAGCRTVSGDRMFAHQAALQFRHFCGLAPPWAEWERLLDDELTR